MGKIILRLDRVMADRKMSLKELSEIVGVSNVNLSKMKTGKISAIRFSTLVAICEALDCQPGDLLEYDKNADSQKKSFGNTIMGGSEQLPGGMHNAATGNAGGECLWRKKCF